MFSKHSLASPQTSFDEQTPKDVCEEAKHSQEKSTLGARDFSSAVSGLCQVFIVTRAARGLGQKNLWYPG